MGRQMQIDRETGTALLMPPLDKGQGYSQEDVHEENYDP
jgi:hypothetical protein